MAKTKSDNDEVINYLQDFPGARIEPDAIAVVIQSQDTDLDVKDAAIRDALASNANDELQVDIETVSTGALPVSQQDTVRTRTDVEQEYLLRDQTVAQGDAWVIPPNDRADVNNLTVNGTLYIGGEVAAFGDVDGSGTITGPGTLTDKTL